MVEYPVNDHTKIKISSIRARQEPLKVILCTPDYFDVEEITNVYMEGNSGNIDKEKAKHQWNDLKSIYEGLHKKGTIEDLWIIDGQPNCVDMVFCANQSLPWKDSEENDIVILSNMLHPYRQSEIVFFEKFYHDAGYKTIPFGTQYPFEGMGDTIVHPGKQLLYGGYGYRTEEKAFDELSILLKVPVIKLKMNNPLFYHLDTCFLPISESVVLLCRDAFDTESIEKLAQFFTEIIVIPQKEASSTFSLNAHCIVNNNVHHKVAIMHPGGNLVREILEKHGYEVIETDTSEFMKSGGSVFCMKMMAY